MEKFEYEEKIHIIQDLEDKNIFYGAIKTCYDEQDELTIISSGNTKEIALENSIKKILGCLNKSINLLKQINILLSGSDYLDGDFHIEPEYIKKEHDLGHCISHGFNALFFNKEYNCYGRLHR